jgi:hypothetical protein
VVESWRYPRSNVFKTGATFWSMLTSGANDAAYGVRRGNLHRLPIH